MLDPIWINIISNGLGFIGSCIVFKYGIPNQIDTDGHDILVVSQKNKQQVALVKKYKALSHLGLIMIAASFFIQLLSGFGIM